MVVSGSSPCPSASQSLPAGEAEMWPQGLCSSGNFRLRLPSPHPHRASHLKHRPQSYEKMDRLTKGKQGLRRLQTLCLI